MEMTADRVLHILSTLNNIGAKTWISGGWAVDALVNKQTRKHNDIDLAFNKKDEEKIIKTFTHLGFFITDDARPTRFVLRNPNGTVIDLHPVVFNKAGIGEQLVPNGKSFFYPLDAFSVGEINGTKVPCLSAKQLVIFHTGYEPLEKDRHNMRTLHNAFGIELPQNYQKD